MKIFDEPEQEFEANGEFLNALWTDGMCANLQVVQMNYVTFWHPNEMSFMELILSKVRLLHTLYIRHYGGILMSNEDALNGLPRYNREAQIVLEGRETKIRSKFQLMYSFYQFETMDKCTNFSF